MVGNIHYRDNGYFPHLPRQPKKPDGLVRLGGQVGIRPSSQENLKEMQNIIRPLPQHIQSFEEVLVIRSQVFLCTNPKSSGSSGTNAACRWRKKHLNYLTRLGRQLPTCSSAGQGGDIPPEDKYSTSIQVVAYTVMRTKDRSTYMPVHRPLHMPVPLLKYSQRSNKRTKLSPVHI